MKLMFKRNNWDGIRKTYSRGGCSCCQL